MKAKMIFAALGFLAFGCDRNDNLPDSVDANLTPAAQEEREEEVINQPDYVDENLEPAHEEERELEEESIYE